jgi:putative ABC transport system ATP-binding protein
MQEPMSPVVVESVSYEYRDALQSRKILHDVNLTIESGEIIILTGPSGSGKTTLLTLIGALRKPQVGSVRVLDRELVGASERARVKVRRDIGYIFQQHNLLDYLTVAQNIALSLQLSGKLPPRKEARQRIIEVLAQVGLADQVDKLPGALSGGQKQRVGIARALVTRPRLILADEPTASLDKESGRNVVTLIQELCREQGATVILVTHDNRILDVADRILHLEDGEIQSISEAVASSTSRMLKLLDRHDPGSSQYLSAFALGLTRVAMADNAVDDAEREMIRQSLNAASDLSSAEVDLVMELAMTQIRCRHQLAEGAESPFNAEQTRHFMSSLRAVAAADGEVSEDELIEIQQIASELGFRA